MGSDGTGFTDGYLNGPNAGADYVWGTDDDYPLEKPEIEKLFNHPENWLGIAKEQVDAFTESVGIWIQRFPETSSLKREPLL